MTNWDNMGAEASALSNGPEKNSSYSILVVDDHSDYRQLSVEVLTNAGYSVKTVKDGAEAWDELQINRYDLIITDNRMPKMTGIELIETLKCAHMTLGIIMATGLFPMFEFARKPWLKPDAMLLRPFSNDDLLEAVSKILHPPKS